MKLRSIQTFLLVALGGLLVLLGSLWQPVSASINAEACTYQGISLYGDVQVVDSFPDITVQEVSGLADLNVQVVSSFPDSCGMWRYTDSFPDFTVQFVDSLADIQVKFVSSFPGIP